MTFPVAVISFNRPDYLVQTLDSLKIQTEPLEICLFQDEPRKTSDESLIIECIRLFRERFPRGVISEAPCNLGPGLNIAAAEEWLFEELEAEAGAIFEDDMVVTPHYVATLQAMLAANKDDERIAYVAAYGPILKVPAAAANSYTPMHLNWAFAATRRQWLKRKPLVDHYLDILGGRDYRDRDIVAIMALRERWGLPGPYTTQDVMRAAATHKVGGLRLNTYAHLGKYIGGRGLHIDEQTYNAVGFANWPLHQGPLTGFGKVNDATARWCEQLTEQFIGTGSRAA